MNPEYRYEGGRFGNVAVHVLYQPGDERTWGGGVAVQQHRDRAGMARRPVRTVPLAPDHQRPPDRRRRHRVSHDGHDGSAGQDLILHEVGHNYLMGILANNEWREGFLDEGFTSFQTTWFNETRARGGEYAGLERSILLLDLDGWSEPTSLVSERYRDFSTYNTMIYDRGELFFHQLRNIVGDAAMRRILRTYYQRWKLKHVDEAAFRAVAEEVSKRDLSRFFAQWLHTTELYDYAVGKVKTARRTGGSDAG